MKKSNQTAPKAAIFSVLLVTSLVSGCAVNPEGCDPTHRDASIIEKGRCNWSGAYQVRSDHLEKVVLDERKTNAMLTDVYNAIEQEKRQSASNLKKTRDQYATVTRALNALLTEVGSKAKGNRAIEKEIADLSQQLEALKTQDSPSVLQKQAELDQLKTKVVGLEQQLGLGE
ncbi:conserved hypothetical protein [gamma proteobacterium HdN1]|nr:conserved hypothetical protein [gamma proteobacterium HdN1]